MNNNVLKFPQPKVKGTQPTVRTFPNLPPYYCTRCQTEAFRLYENGAVHCNGCGSAIRNLKLCES